MRVRTRRIAWALSCLVLVALLVFAAQQLDLARVFVELRAARPSWLLAATACYALLLPLWAMQWHILSPRATRNTLAQMLGVVAITSSTLNTTVLLLGEATGVVLLVARIGLERSAALSVLAMDQLLVGLAKLTVLITAAWLLVLPPWMLQGITGLSAGVAALLVGTVVAAWHYDAIAARADALLPPRASNALRTMGRTLAPLRSPVRGGSALALALAKKLVEIGAILCVQQAFAVSVPISASVLILAALGIATMLPFAPANIGVYEGVVAVVYTRLGIPAEQAVGMAMVQHACYLAAVALPGFGWLAAS